MFHYHHQHLYCENVPLTQIAASAGTPVYVYSRQTLRTRVARFQPDAPSRLVCYAVKANGNPTILRQLRDAGCGADVTSGGELFLALHAGIAPEKIIFSGVGKTAAEIEAALDAGIRALHVESHQELAGIQHIAARRKQPARISIRVNPNIAVETHPYISTGQKRHKFGVDPETAVQLMQTAADDPWLQPVGLAAHIGSQITAIPPFDESAASLVRLADTLAANGIRLRYIDVGGGLGIDYEGEPVPKIGEWTTVVSAPVLAAGYDVVMELGRSLVGPAGILLTQVVYTKSASERHFAIVDAGMNDLIRPTLYNAFHPILPVQEPSAATTVYDVVGPVCESGDWLGKERPLPTLHNGDLLAVTHAGAYGFGMSSNYNGRLRPAEVLVNGDQFQVIRQRQTFQDLIAGC